MLHAPSQTTIMDCGGGAANKLIAVTPGQQGLIFVEEIPGQWRKVH